MATGEHGFTPPVAIFFVPDVIIGICRQTMISRH